MIYLLFSNSTVEKLCAVEIVFLKTSYVHENSLIASFVATVSTGHYQFVFPFLEIRWGFSVLACS